MDDAEIPDDFQERSIKNTVLFNEIIDENKKIVDDALQILMNTLTYEKVYIANLTTKVDGIKVNLKKEYDELPEEIKLLFNFDLN